MRCQCERKYIYQPTPTTSILILSAGALILLASMVLASIAGHSLLTYAGVYIGSATMPSAIIHMNNDGEKRRGTLIYFLVMTLAAPVITGAFEMFLRLHGLSIFGSGS